MKKQTYTFTISEYIDLLNGKSMQNSPAQLNKLKILTNIEQYLSKKLKEVCCQDGTEQDTTQSAIIFHKLGLVYKERSFVNVSDQKRCLIKSAVLFNAALVRKPRNVQMVQDDLNELCSHVWCLAGVNQENARLSVNAEFLSSLSREIASLRNQVKTEVYDARMKIHKGSAENARKHNLTEQIEKLQEDIYNKYCKLMENVTKYCISLRPSLPCKFALIGMGSLAKKEITPYSDFEHALVLQEGVQNDDNYQEILEYFRWFSVIFQMSVINLGETIIPSICLPFINNPFKKSFNWFFDVNTRRGISFDGMMPHACKFPLGREETEMKFWKAELIKPVSEMLKYLWTYEESKKDYQLADMLKTTCFVAGDEAIYNEFHQNAKHCKMDVAACQRLVSKDIRTFNPFKTLPNMLHTPKWNLKRVVYRSFGLFIEVLGKLYGVKANSGFKIIRYLIAKDIFDRQFGEDLLFAATAAYYLRLISYANENSQYDYLRSPEKPEEYAEIFDEWIGIKSAVRFFKVVLKLQQFASLKIGLTCHEELNEYTDIHYHLHSCWLLRQHSDAEGYCTELLSHSKSSILDVAFASHTLYLCGSDAYHDKDYLKAKKYLVESLDHWKTWQHRLWNVEISSHICEQAASQQKTRLQDEKSLMNQQVEMYKDVVAHTFNRLGRCLFQEDSFHEALKQHETALQLTRNIIDQDTASTSVATYLKNMGECMFKIRRWNAANDLFSKAANIWKETEDQSFLSDIDECDDYMRQCKLFCGESQLNVEPYPQLSHSLLENSEIVIDHAEECEVLKNHGEDYHCKPEATARFGNSILCRRPSLSPQNDRRFRNNSMKRFVKLKISSHPILHDTNKPTSSSHPDVHCSKAKSSA